MGYTELISDYQRILNLISEKRIAEAIEEIDKLAVKCRNIDYRNRLANNKETYRNILKYSFEFGDDPEKEKVYSRLVKALIELTDEIKEEIIKGFNLLSYYHLSKKEGWKSDVTEEETAGWIDRISLEKEVEKLLKNKSSEIDNKGFFQPGVNMIDKLFTSLWLSDKLNDKQIKLLKNTCNNEHLPWYYKSTIVSALTLSALRHFDIEKLNLLFDFYQVKEHQVWQRSMIGILIILYRIDSRIPHYPEIGQRIKAYHDDKKWNKTIEIIVIQFLRALDTEKISAKIRDEIIPELWKARSMLEEKLNMEELLSEKTLEDKNPEWETVFEDSPDLYNKIEEFSNLQMEGSDVFLSAFAMLKRFDFFDVPANWFLPFYQENELLTESFGDVKEGFDSSSFLAGLERTRFLCNSDKYSFCLNVKHMPAMQKSMMVEFFKMELEAMNEMAGEDEIAQYEMQSRTVIIQYIQDLYRFFRLHPLKKEFDDIFELPLDFHNSAFFRLMVDDPSIIRNIAEFYFGKEHFQEALQVFLGLQKTNNSYELLEKIAYCYQKSGQFDKALDYYKKAEMIAEPSTWLLNKIAYCYRKLQEHDSAIEYYKQSEKVDPENLYIQSSLGQVHMDKGDFEKALKYFFKVEYLAPDNLKVHRPIAWCSFVLNKPEVAKKYFDKVIKREGNQYDYMNLGHVSWSMGEKAKAIENYRKSLAKAGNDFQWFAKLIDEDSPYLMQYGISSFDIPLMLDYLKINSGDGNTGSS